MILNQIAFMSALSANNPVSDQETFVTYSGFQYGGATSAAIQINIQPASPELTAMSEGEMFKTYKAFTSASGVTEGMLLTVSGTNNLYRVRGRRAVYSADGPTLRINPE